MCSLCEDIFRDFGPWLTTIAKQVQTYTHTHTHAPSPQDLKSHDMFVGGVVLSKQTGNDCVPISCWWSLVASDFTLPHLFSPLAHCPAAPDTPSLTVAACLLRSNPRSGRWALRFLRTVMRGSSRWTDYLSR